MILIGRGAQGKGELVEKLAQRLGAGVIYSMPAKGVITLDFKYLVGGFGLAGSHGASQLLEESDCILIIGSTWWPDKFVPKGVPIIQMDGIMENIGINTEINVGIEGCILKTLKILLEGIKAKANKKWVENICSVRKQYLAKLMEEVQNTNPITPQRLIKSVEKTVEPDAVIALDVGEHVLWFNKFFQGERQYVLISGSWRSMGFGLPAALSAKLEFPKRQVVALVGDGGITMSMGELATAFERGLAVKVVVFNNKSLSMERNRMILVGLARPVLI